MTEESAQPSSSSGGGGSTVIGDPLEKATLSALGWNLTKADAVVPGKKANAVGAKDFPAMKIFTRYCSPGRLQNSIIFVNVVLSLLWIVYFSGITFPLH